MSAMDKKNLKDIWDKITEKHENLVVDSVNDHNLHLAVNEGTYPWHYHPNSDEFFGVIEGSLLIEFEGAESVTLKPFETFLVEAGRVHQTTAQGRTVNLCFERKDAGTIFLKDKESD